MDKRYRKTVIAGNWKMNGLSTDLKTFADEIRTLIPRTRKCEVALCVSATLLQPAVRALKETKIAVGAQDISPHQSGAYTGEVSGAQLQEIGVKYVIIGHSERRSYHGETNELVNAKVVAALNMGLTPIICVGETLEQRELGITLEVVGLQVKTALAGLSVAEVKRTIIAYEPVWAIGTGKTATAEDAGAVCTEIRAVIRKMHDARVARRITIQYGGSMNAKNAAELLEQPDIDGGLIGGASLKPAEFAQIILAADYDTYAK